MERVVIVVAAMVERPTGTEADDDAAHKLHPWLK
jgi:hypothetical protein